MEEEQKYLKSFISNTTYHPMNPDADATYQTVNLFSSCKCFIYFISDVSHFIRSNQYNTVCKILVKLDVLYTCGAMICLYFGIALLLFSMKIENTVHIFSWFLTSWKFRITSLLNLNKYQCYYHLNLSMIEGFHGFVMFSLSLSNSVQQCQENFTKDARQKMLISWQTYEILQISVN